MSQWVILMMSNCPKVDKVKWTFCFVVVELLSHVQLSVTPWTVARQASLSFTVSQSLCTHVHWVSDAIQLAHPLLLAYTVTMRWLGSQLSQIEPSEDFEMINEWTIILESPIANDFSYKQVTYFRLKYWNICCQSTS